MAVAAAVPGARAATPVGGRVRILSGGYGTAVVLWDDGMVCVRLDCDIYRDYWPHELEFVNE